MLEPITIVRSRVQATWVLIVTKPETAAAANHRRTVSEFFSVGTDGGISSAEEISIDAVADRVDFDIRSIAIATIPIAAFIPAATRIVFLMPRDGNKMNPAARAPITAPERLHV